MNFRLITLTFTYLGGLFFFANSDASPPYPIIFIHGLTGNDQTWDDVNTKASLQKYAQWRFGGTIHVCLDFNNTDLNATSVEEDVRIYDPFSKQFYKEAEAFKLPIRGDYYYINFHVDAQGRTYKDAVAELAKSFNPDDNVVLAVGKPFSNIEDIFHINYLIRIQDEIMRVKNIEFEFDLLFGTTAKLTVDRGLYDTPRFKSFTPILNVEENDIFVISNQSNQAAIQKHSRGVKLAIDAVKNVTKAKKVILIGHSMGGLSARAYIQGEDFENDVAKVITTSTPHLGSGTEDFRDQTSSSVEYLGRFTRNVLNVNIDERSDAARDLRYSINVLKRSYPFGNSPDDGVFLFGGDETKIPALISQTSITQNYLYYHSDVNANGLMDDSTIVGLNSRPFPSSVNYHWITAQSFDEPPGDGVVQLSRQSTSTPSATTQHVLAVHGPPVNYIQTLRSLILLFNWNISGALETFLTIPPVTSHIDAIIRGLDEPNNFSNAYEIPISSQTDGFITESADQFGRVIPGQNLVDPDFYRFKAPQKSNALIIVSQIHPDVNDVGVAIYSSPDSNPIKQSNSNGQSSVTLSVDQLEPDSYYYIKVEGVATEKSWEQPYKLEIRTDVAVSGSKHYAQSRSFTIDLRQYDSYGNLAFGPSSSQSTTFFLDTRSKLGIGISFPFALDTRPNSSFSLEIFELDFGETAVGRSRKLSLSILNSGDRDLILSSILPNINLFKVTKLESTINPGKQGSIEIEFKPDVLGMLSEELQLQTNAPGQELIKIALKGVGIEIKFPGDFSGDNIVDFDDFFLFADVFGLKRGDDRFQEVFDLDSDGEIGFGDFFIFADSFGQESRAKLIELAYQYLNLPNKHALLSNYPNPFNPSTTIQYQIPSETDVEITIYDLLGRKIRSFLLLTQLPGYYKIQWDGRDETGKEVASGIYFYRMKASNFICSKKMILTK